MAARAEAKRVSGSLVRAIGFGRRVDGVVSETSRPGEASWRTRFDRRITEQTLGRQPGLELLVNGAPETHRPGIRLARRSSPKPPQPVAIRFSADWGSSASHEGREQPTRKPPA